jgi:transcriptional regulator with XRE-family HTH domain
VGTSQAFCADTIHCHGCGRAQFDRGQSVCIACRKPIRPHVEVAPVVPIITEPVPKNKKSNAINPTVIGNRLRTVREALGINQCHIAEQAETSRTQVSRVEGGYISAGLPYLLRTVGPLFITVAELLDCSITVQELAVLSLCRSPYSELMIPLVEFLPQLSQSKRGQLLAIAGGFIRPYLAPTR